MPAAEGVVDVLDGEVYLFDLAGRKRFRFFETVAELSTKRFTADQLLIPAHGERKRRNIGSGLVSILRFGSVEFAVRIVRRIHVNQFHIPVRIAAGRRHKQSWRDRPRDCHILLQYWS